MDESHMEPIVVTQESMCSSLCDKIMKNMVLTLTILGKSPHLSTRDAFISHSAICAVFQRSLMGDASFSQQALGTLKICGKICSCPCETQRLIWRQRLSGTKIKSSTHSLLASCHHTNIFSSFPTILVFVMFFQMAGGLL